MSKILIAEDNDNTRELFRIIMANAGFDVSTVEDGQAAMTAVVNSSPDLVILDVMLPKIHGYSICHQIKSNAALRDIKVLIVSAKNYPEDLQRAKDMGADGFLSKTTDADELVRTVKELLR